jgi:hypothetical protein
VGRRNVRNNDFPAKFVLYPGDTENSKEFSGEK